MGWNNDLFPLLIVISGPPFSGMFVYSPGPGAGNLIASISAQAGTDPYGNPFPQGISSIAEGVAEVTLINATLQLATLGANASALAGALTVGSTATGQAVGLGSGQGPEAGAISSQLTVADSGGVNGGPGLSFAMGTSTTTLALGPTGDTTGVKDTAAINSALSNNHVRLMPGTFTIKAGQIIAGLGQRIYGSGKSVTTVKVLDTTAGAAGFTLVNATGVYQPAQNAQIGHMTVDGTGSAIVTHGVQAGDIAGLYFDDLEIQNFTGSPFSKGLLLFNQHFFTEQAHGYVYVRNCSIGVGLDVAGTGTGSFDRMDLDIWLGQNDTQFGVSLLGGATGAFIEGGRLGIWGNFGAGATHTGAVLDFEGTGSAILHCQLDIGVECNGAGTGPKTINFGSGHGVIQRCYGVMEFVAAPVAFQASNPAQQVDYNGRITGDTSLLIKANLIDVTTISAGFPAGWSGSVDIKKMGETGLVFINFSLAVANGTVVTNLEVIAGPIASQFFNAAANNTVDVWLQGGGLNQAQSILIGNTGNLQVNGPGFTPAGSTAFLTGAAVYSNSY